MALIRPISTSEISTSLWQNSSPTSGFVAQNVTLSDDINNYSKIKVVFRAATDTSTEFSTIVDVSDYLATGNTSGYYLGSCVYRHTSGLMCKRFYYSNATTLAFSQTDQVAGTTQDNNIVVPIEILGIK